jgi:hypothetical protein
MVRLLLRVLLLLLLFCVLFSDDTPHWTAERGMIKVDEVIVMIGSSMGQSFSIIRMLPSCELSAKMLLSLCPDTVSGPYSDKHKTS